MDALFGALAHAGRRRMLDIIRQHGGCSVNEVAAQFEVSRIAVMKNLKVLVEAKLIISEKHGRTRRLYFNAVPIQLIYDRWTSEYSALWASRITRLKYEIEGDLGKQKTKSPKRSRKATAKKKRAARSGRTTQRNKP